ncbi:deaminase [Streptomyces albus subsp. chlorinus]|uniref:dihydrofolate reductase family protein n=1 Tax=Streptomyces albus TaxID=1888 RepID=UPI00156F7ECE|nr:dihydrofolate reductase family protein [Streptomyces albus]NSC23559.1 deaminase [Streptomyces albus subsp. chlorinus]
MGALKVHEFITLDGVIEAPSWTAPYPFGEEMTEAVGALTASSDAILLGRATYEMFAPAWSSRGTEDDPGALFFNETAKYVVSSTLERAADWNNSTVLGPYGPEAVRELKENSRGVYVSGSATLVRALLADGLVDELHLFVYPLTLGSGQRLFPEGAAAHTLSLTRCERFEGGVAHMVYGPAA